MNIHPSHTVSPDAPAEWTTAVLFEEVDPICQCICVVLRRDIEMARISMTNKDGDRDAARLVAAEKARAWIASFLKR